MAKAELIAPIHERVAAPCDDRGHRVAVRKMFSDIAPTYDLLNRLLSMRIDQRWRQQAMQLLLNGLPAGRILDLCAGTLDITADVQRLEPKRHVVAADFALPMLVRGKHKVRADQGIANADALNLPFADQTFQGVICAFGMRNLADPKRGLDEVFRCLKPGGRLVVLEFFKPQAWTTRLFHRVYARMVLPTVGRLLSKHREAYAYLAASMQGFYTLGEYAELARQAGFVVRVERNLTLGVASILVAEKV